MLLAWLNVNFSWYHWQQQQNRSWFDYQTRRDSESIWKTYRATFFTIFCCGGQARRECQAVLQMRRREFFPLYCSWCSLCSLRKEKQKMVSVFLYNEETISLLFWVVCSWANSSLLLCRRSQCNPGIIFGVFSAVLSLLTARHYYRRWLHVRSWYLLILHISQESVESVPLMVFYFCHHLRFFFVYKTTAEFWISSIISPIQHWETTSSGASAASSTANCVRSSVTWRGSAYRTTITGVIILVIWILRITFYTRAIWLRKKAACTMAQR